MLSRNCSADLGAFHKNEVKLPRAKIEDLLKKSRCIRKLLCKGLMANGYPIPYKHTRQGSFMMATMVRSDKEDYDIDDGAYFLADDLKGCCKDGHQQAMQMVKHALNNQSNSFTVEEMRNCIRINFFHELKHIDIPVYKIVKKEGGQCYMHASSMEWKESDVLEVEKWFESHRTKYPNKKKQILRITRLLKRFAKAHQKENNPTLSGYCITILVSEVPHIKDNRDDVALYKTMKNIHHRLKKSTTIRSKTSGREVITKRDAGNSAHIFKNHLGNALKKLEPLLNGNCDRKTALECWDNVFNDDYFSRRCGKKKPKTRK